MINFRKRSLNQQKPQFEKFQKYLKKCMKTWNKMQKEGQKRTYRLMKRKTLQKIRRKMTKNCGLALSNLEREKKVWKPFWKVSLKCQTLIFKNLIHEFRLIKNQFWLIETNGGFFKNFKTISIDRKIDWINWSR